MAKLSAHGTEVYRLVQETERVQASSTDAKRQRVTVSIRSDLAVLRKVQVLFPPLSFQTDKGDTWHDYGWKLKFTRAQILAKGDTAEILRDKYLKAGFKLEV